MSKSELELACAEAAHQHERGRRSLPTFGQAPRQGRAHRRRQSAGPRTRPFREGSDRRGRTPTRWEAYRGPDQSWSCLALHGL